MEAEIQDNPDEAIAELTMSFMALGKATPRSLGKRQKYISPSPDKGASKRKSFVAHKSKRYSRHNTGGSGGKSSLGALVVNAIKEDEEMGDEEDENDDDEEHGQNNGKASSNSTSASSTAKPSDIKLQTRSDSSHEEEEDEEDEDALPTPPGAEGCCTIS